MTWLFLKTIHPIDLFLDHLFLISQISFMKTSSVSRRMFLTGIGAAAIVPVVGKAAISTATNPVTGKKRHAPISGKVLAAQWKVLSETKLAAHVPPGLARQIYRRLLANVNA
jgi:hypothetical protein